ncbi:glycerophosphodiester phosphodiesterase family protein [Sphingomonas sp.]|uniref:glycerophosphodiester phosphodiesterase family protein n=1 Tax=Sphingomonas sp. TaxID=28214 RepID=UPI0038B3F416
MRSSPSGPDPLDPGPCGFAHRGLHSGSAVPENSLAAFAAAIDLGAGIECDLRLTADDQLVAFHDADARRLCASALRIGESRWQDLAGLRVGGHPIPTLGSLLQLAIGKIPLLLEAKVDGDWRRWVPALQRELAGYRGRFGIMTFDPRLCRLIRRPMPGVRRGLLLKDRQSSFERVAYMRIAAPDFLGVERLALGKRWVASARQSMPVYAWTIRTAAERAQAEVQADALIWEGDGRPRN